MNGTGKHKRRHGGWAFAWLAGAVFFGVLVIGTLRDPNFWLTADQRGDALCRRGAFKEAANVYTDPLRIGVAQYRDGSFEGAAKTFARVPGAIGAYNAGNALLMRGKYNEAMSSYDRALSFRPGWKAAEENKALASARQKALEASAKGRDQVTMESDTPDEIVFDQKGDNKDRTPDLAADGPGSDADLQAIWLRRVQTTPGDFLRAKFAYQAAHPEPRGAK